MGQALLLRLAVLFSTPQLWQGDAVGPALGTQQKLDCPWQVPNISADSCQLNPAACMR